jgi:hypothetical protein
MVLMADPRYLAVQRFYDIAAVETVGARHGAPADPTWLQVKVTPSDDLDNTIEVVDGDVARLYRVRKGTWVFAIDEALMQPGVGYTVHWRFTMSPENVNVVRTNFIWQPIPPIARDDEHTVIFGQLADPQGIPVPDAKLVMETYADMGTLSHRTGQVTIYADAFGMWNAEVHQGELYRFVLGEVSKIVQAPRDQGRHSLSSLQTFQPKDIIRRDRYGYPVPGQDLRSVLMRRLTENETLAVLQSMSVVTFVNESESVSDNVTIEEGAEIYVHEQTAESTIWVIQHGKDCTPIVSVIDTENDLMYPDVSYPDRDTVVLTFQASMTGKAVLICGPEHELLT